MGENLYGRLLGSYWRDLEVVAGVLGGAAEEGW